MKKRNGIISLWKFLFAIVIVFFHCSSFYGGERNAFFFGGYICVEFFFIVSGFYLAKKVLNSKNKEKNKKIAQETIEFVLKKIKGFYPYVFIGFILSILLILCFRVPHYKLNEIVNSIWNLLLLRTVGFRSVLVMAQLWYLTAMIVTIFILYPILRKYRENFILYFSPIIVVLGLGYLNHFWLGLDHSYSHWNDFICTGLLRAFIELNIGFLIYMINQKFKNVEYTQLGKWVLTLLGEVLMMVVLFIISFVDAPKYYDYVMLLFIAIAITIFVSEKTYEYDVLSVKLFFFLEKLSMPIFINHTVVISFVTYIKPFSQFIPKNQSVITVLLTIVFSIAEFYFIEYMRKKEIIKKIKSLFVINA